MGAIAFQKDLGAVHACAHALGAVCDLHHGLANALMIDTVLAWNLGRCRPSSTNWPCRRHGGGGTGFIPGSGLKAQVGIQPAAWPAASRSTCCRARWCRWPPAISPADQPAAGHRGRLRAPVPRRCEPAANPMCPPT